MSYIVVSDVHLGSKLCNFDEFCSFLEWILDLKGSPKKVPLKDGAVEIRSPERIILLGDILELWDPEDGDRDNVVKQCLRPLSLLSDLGCDKVYVMGNHDNAVSSYEQKIDYETLRNGTKLDIWNRHYPDEMAGMRIGDRSYYFLHGHQFDKAQSILAKVSKILGETWDPLNWFNSQYNTSVTKNHWKLMGILWAALFVGWFIKQDLVASSYFLYTVPAALLFGLFLFSSLPAVVTKSQRRIYDIKKPKDKTARQIIEEKFYQEQKDTITADVVVFGHTHFASSYQGEAGKKKLFINSGSWVGEDEEIDGKMRYSNTFIYIDEAGAHILRWKGGVVEPLESH
ncbi:UDP-2,3-diacylglucosamine diphosphatase [Candidatus Methanocrinis natronophilus]|uniref:UDP-2,3-diacylglucosamine diphosphatase n=1 Tax=Candidatus Methanocrinis natronophilus TaxID=3033396 RepID=A0ABT5X5H5_9EURY|nr:UDP-2,3-diacylglucosamine diphosphatase [Candidatus Methanocrinis natronophilus]MDF0589950.1 UDP-2,3-diacylglucosamine diphosphatase [Candidatus Methanocrinis natronophilus]